MINARWFYGISRPTYKKHKIWKGNLYLTEKKVPGKKVKTKCGVGETGARPVATHFFLIYHITFKGNSTKVNFIWKGHLSAWFSSGSEVPHTCNFRAVNVLKQGVQVLQHAPYHGVSCNNTRGQSQHMKCPRIYIGNNGVSSCQLQHFCLINYI